MDFKEIGRDILGCINVAKDTGR